MTDQPEIEIDAGTRERMKRRAFVRELNKLCVSHGLCVSPSEDSDGRFDGFVVHRLDPDSAVDYPYECDATATHLMFSTMGLDGSDV